MIAPVLTEMIKQLVQAVDRLHSCATLAKMCVIAVLAVPCRSNI